jgi:hypothetical protein
MIILLTFTIILFYLELPNLISQKRFKELITYLTIYLIGFMLMTGHILHWDIPRPGVMFLEMANRLFPAFIQFMTPEGG